MDFFPKLAAYAEREPPVGVGERLALVGQMAARALRSARRALAFDRPPIVLGGCGRSGTTLLLSMLSAHPRIFAIPVETLALCPTGYRAEPDLEAPFEMRRIRRQMLLREIPPGALRWCEKTPRNVLYFGRILERFGDDVRLVHVVRDGRDVVTSRHPTDPERTWVTPARWIEDVAAGRRVEDDPRVLAVRYEDLVDRYPETITRVCRFLDEEPVDEVLDWYRHATVRSNVAWSGEVKPLHRGSLERWRRPEHAAVVEELLADERARELLRHYDYL